MNSRGYETNKIFFFNLVFLLIGVGTNYSHQRLEINGLNVLMKSKKFIDILQIISQRGELSEVHS
jgi:hypothetical protein